MQNVVLIYYYIISMVLPTAECGSAFHAPRAASYGETVQSNMQFLESIKVVEFSHMVMGPSAGMILADLGAQVVKIEPIGGDKTRRLPGSGAGYFAMFNRNKHSICVDIKSPEGAEVVRDLLRDADVMIENFRPGALDRLGLDYESVRALNPRIIYQSSKGFLSGPYEQRTALDEVAQMMGGLAYMTGPENRPLRAGSSVVDITGGMFGVIGILAALQRRHQTGEGARVTSALFETTAFLVGQHIAQHAVTGVAAKPMPSRVSAWAIYDVFDASDGQVFVGVVSDTQWRQFCEVFGFAEWAVDQSLAANRDRVERRPDILPRLRDLFAGMTTADLQEKLAAAGLPYAPINRPEDLVEDAHLSYGGFHTLTLPGSEDTVQLPKLPIEIDGDRGDIRHDLPDIGEDSDRILADLGYTEAKIGDLKAMGAIA